MFLSLAGEKRGAAYQTGVRSTVTSPFRKVIAETVAIPPSPSWRSMR